MTRDEIRQLIHDKNNGLIEMTESQIQEALKYYTQLDIDGMVNIPFDYSSCFKCKCDEKSTS